MLRKGVIAVITKKADERIMAMRMETARENKEKKEEKIKKKWFGEEQEVKEEEKKDLKIDREKIFNEEA